jgi:hypothetical protein
MAKGLGQHEAQGPLPRNLYIVNIPLDLTQ